VSAVALEGVSVSLGGRRVVDDVTTVFERGEWTVVIGPNGAGKTTLLRAIAGLVAFDGSIRLLGRTASSLGRRELSRLLAVLPQEPSTPAWMSVSSYVLLGRTPYIGTFASEARGDLEASSRALERLDLVEFGDRALGTLSGGEKQRAVIARALAQEAEVILLDEPTTALDIGHQQQTLELLDALRHESSLTLIAAMHDLTLAAQFADRMLMLDHGRVVADGTPGEVVTGERLSRHYEATVEVVPVGGRIAVVPRRQTPMIQTGPERGTWAP
jgi:iron complex transport system ATP-binding protein